MPLTPGTRFGTCEIAELLGAGGMGEVYRARDTALGREVAVKVLPPAFAADAERLRRFGQEAQAAAALNHPNILTIYHVGEQDGAPYIVSELLEGESLRERLRAGALPVRKAVDYAMQVASGLASAHDKGIVHRDLKPENLFLARDGRVKILDFGLAKLTQASGEGAGSDLLTAAAPAGTGAGTVLGTVGYMSPEQVRAQPVDGRSDLFSLGAILYEMVSGSRAFHGATPADTLSAILREEPPSLTASTASVPPALERVVRHCLEKNPFERFQSARDLAFDLSEISSLSSSSSASAVGALAPLRGRRPALLALGALALAAAAAAVGWWAHRPAGAATPAFHRLTFRRGTIVRARFGPDGKTVVYGAAWDGAPPETFLVSADSPESRSLGVPRSDVYAVSPSGEIALSLRKGYPFPPEAGTLARAPLLGGAAPREVMDKVEYADWGPGEALAVTLDTGVGDRLEYPIGSMVYEAPGPIHQIRVSPDGELVAFQEVVEGRSALSVVDRRKQKRLVSKGWLEVHGLAWRPDGREIWVAGKDEATGFGLFAVELSGARRLVLRSAGPLELHDLSRDGRVLLSYRSVQTGIRYLPPGSDQERDLSWLDGSSVADLSPDGQSLLFSELGEAGGSSGAVYLRKTGGSPAVRLGPGVALGLSPDGKWALTGTRSRLKLGLLPVGVGEPRPIAGSFARYWGAQWLPDGRLLIAAMEAGHDPRLYVQALDGEPRAISPEGLLSPGALSPDGRSYLCRVGEAILVLSLDGGDPHPVAGIDVDETPLRWAKDGSVFVAHENPDMTTSVYRVELATRKRSLFRTLAPADRAGIVSLNDVRLGADGRSYAYSYVRQLGELYLVEGLR
jgi:eukaryotic-like serine/threonine-protein kinase